MFKNFFKIAWRNMQKQKMYALINIGGFAIGIAACLLIGLYIRHETSYDTDNPNRDRVYRIVGEATSNGIRSSGVGFPAPMATALLNDFPEVEKAGRIMSNELFGGANNQIRRPDQTADTYEKGFAFADTSILDILNVKMIYGNRKDALSEPNSVVLCQSLANKYFPGQDPVGKTLVFNDNTKDPIKIGGVMQDFPSNSHLQYRGFISLAGVSLWAGEQQQWTASNYDIYLQLKPNVTDIELLDKKMTADILDKYMIPAGMAAGRKNIREDFSGAKLYLQPLRDIHLHSYNIQQDDVQHGDIRIIHLFAAIAAVILIIACINFINLSTARSANRAKEVGIRKVIGSSRIDLIRRFLAESMLYSLLSFIIALVLTQVALPLFTGISNLRLVIPWSEWWFAPLLFASVLIIGLVAGLYPAFYLSYFKPADTLKGSLSTGSENGKLRGTLVVFQFTVSIVLIIATSVVYKQMQYILNSKIGFDKDQVLMIQGADALHNQTASFKEALLTSPFVGNVSVSDFLPVGGTKRNSNMFHEKGKDDQMIKTQRWVIDESYIPTLGIKLAEGRNFSTDLPTDSSATIINRAFASELGYADPIGKIVTNGGNPLTIIGVVDNFYYESVKQQVHPVLMVLGKSNSIISVKINGKDMKAALGSIEKIWKQFVPNQAMRYDFLDQSYAAMYVDIQRMQYIFSGFAMLALIIGCLGLFALAAFMAEQRRKEIGVRKVLGATVSNLFTLLTGNLIKLISISLCIATPVAWLLMNKWLQDYAYRINITWNIFISAGLAAFAIALATVSFQAIKAATANPIESLRSE